MDKDISKDVYNTIDYKDAFNHIKEFIDFVIEQQNDDGEQKQIMLDILDTFLKQKGELNKEKWKPTF